MRLQAFVLAMLGSAAVAQVTSKTPITVTGHLWAPFISPMGEPFRARSASDDTLADWFNQADRNHDNVLTLDEFIADAERFFATLDTNHDGQIDPDELAKYEYDIAPDVQVMVKTRRQPGAPAPSVRPADSVGSDNDWEEGSRKSRRNRDADAEASLGIGGALQGAARYGLLNMPEPVAAADTDFNRAVTLEEFKAAAIARFQLLDRAHLNQLTLGELEAMRPVLPDEGHRPKLKPSAIDSRIGNPLPPGH